MSAEQSPSFISGTLEKTSKYLRRWVSRYFKYSLTTRRLDYGEDPWRVKGSIFTRKVALMAEQVDIYGSWRKTGLLVFVVEGISPMNVTETWPMKFKDEAQMMEWYRVIRNGCAASGSMDPYNYGLPPVDPRVGLAFASPPLQCLYRFALLEKTIFYCIRFVRQPPAADGELRLFAAGDKALYVFTLDAHIVHCVPLQAVRKIYAVAPQSALGIGSNGEHPDFIALLEPLNDVVEVCRAIAKAARDLHRVDAAVTELEQLSQVEAAVDLRGPEGYKPPAIAPTGKPELFSLLERQRPAAAASRVSVERRSSSRGASFAMAGA